MSVGPVGLNAAAVSALIDAELAALANDAQALQAQLQPGDVVQAQVLPSNGLTDLVLINGNRVAASLPPTLVPGDVIQVQVTAFDGAQILLQMLDAAAAQTAAATGSGQPAAGSPAATPSGTGTATPGAAAAPTDAASAGSAAVAGGPAPAASVLAGVAAPVLAAARPNVSPTAILTAVAVRAGDTLPAPPQAPVAGAPTNVILPPPAKPSAVPFPLLSGAQPSSIEARLAAARTGLPPSTPLPAPPPPSAAPPVVPSTAPPPSARPFVAPPQIAPAPALAASTAAPSAPAPTATPPAPPVPPAAGLAVFRDPVALVRALGLPVTPTTVAAAKLALENPQRLPNALATLESALPNTDDPRVATLRAVAAFVSRIDPSSPQLASQLASYVEHVVDSTEPKLASALAAQLVAERVPVPGPPAGAAAPAQTAGAPANAPAAAAAQAAAEAAAATEPALPVTILADAAVRATALLHDLKSALFSIIGSPPATAGDELAASATSALTAITGVQLSAANAMVVNPQTLAFTIPLWTGAGYTQAQLQVDRDAPDRSGTALDGDNFHIAFILDTKNLGTVAVDLRTVGRAVNVAVKTQATPAAERFADALSRLTDRLTQLRYRVASSDAQVARPTGPAATVSAPVIPADPPENAMDLRA